MMMTAQQQLQQFQQQLDQQFKTEQDANQALANWLQQQFSSSQLIHFIRQLIADEQVLAEVASRSYQHGNGFLKVVLLDRGYKLRLHIWFAGESCEENIHDHRWSFASLVLAGQLKSEIWRDDAQGQTFKSYQYHAATQQHAPFKQAVADSHLMLDQVQICKAGDSYIMPKRKLHRIINPGHQLVATMMCSAPTEQGTTRLIPIHDGIDPNIQPPKTTAAQLKQALQQFLQHLQMEEFAHAA